jgi:cytochrome c-type biogenesis protein CcmH/NrfG
VRLRPDDADALLNLSAALKLDPADSRSQPNLAAALAQQGDVDAAIAAWQRVLQLDPQDEPARKGLARLLASRPAK